MSKIYGYSIGISVNIPSQNVIPTHFIIQIHFMFSCLFFFGLSDSCTVYYNVVELRPVIISENFDEEQTICINTTLPRMAFAFYNSPIYEEITVRTNDKVLGPFKSKNDIGGYYLGSSSGSVEIKALEGKLEFGAIVYPSECVDMVISSKSSDVFEVKEDSNDPLYITGFDRYLCYWYFTTEKKKYQIEVDTEEEHDYLMFVRNGFENKNFSGKMKEELTISPQSSRLIIWKSDASQQSDYAKVDFERTGNRFFVKKSFNADDHDPVEIILEYEKLTGLEIFGITFGVIAWLSIVIGIILACTGNCCLCCYRCCCCCCCCKHVKPKKCCCCCKNPEYATEDSDDSSVSSVNENRKKTEAMSSTNQVPAPYQQNETNVMFAPQYIPSYPEYLQAPQEGPVYPIQYPPGYDPSPDVL